ncbi:hypothetical protein RJ55_00215 [Drechmeria coniospora]|nr:hypothetical protein RJ55_00215 [Drechmeria coniospora]
MEAKDLPAFVYDPLPSPSHIRLLQRCGTSTGGQLAFSLVTRHVDAPAPDYHCLSYTWGNPFAHGTHFVEHFDAVAAQYEARNAVDIVLDGRALRVQKNLHDALASVPQTAYLDYLNRPLVDEAGKTFLHTSAAEGRAGAVDGWLWDGAEVDGLDERGRAALHYAADKGHSNVVEMLCRAGARRCRRGDDGRTPMDLALAGGHGGVVSILESLSHQPDPLEASEGARKPDRADMLIWADAICINQADVEEKGAQVTMMDRIYSNAAYVVAWLGPPDGQSETGLRTLDTLRAHLQEYTGSQIEPFGGFDRDRYAEASVPFLSWPEWRALASIYQRQWFRRAWIVQEAVLPKILLMYLGRRHVSWYHLGMVADALRHNAAKLGTSRSTVFVPPTDAAVPVEWNMTEMYKYRTNRNMAMEKGTDAAPEHKALFAMKDLVLNFWTFLASEPRDKVFALYGLFNAFADWRLTADYRLSLREVYTATTRRIIADSGSLSALSACVYPEQRGKATKLPSWVPDFSLPAVNAIPETFCADEGLPYVSPPEADAADGRLVLRVRGLKIGTISRVGGRPNTGPSGKLQFDPSWIEMVLSLRSEGAGGEGLVLSEVLWRTLCMDMSPGSLFDASTYGSRAPDGFGSQFRVFMLLMILAGADRMVLEKMGAAASASGTLSVSHLPYNPMAADMEPTLAGLDALAAHDGDRTWTPLRQEVMHFWDKLECTLVRNTTVDADGGPHDFYVPKEVREGTARMVGGGYVVAGSRMFRRCHGFATAYSAVYGGRQLMTVNNTHLGMAPLSAQTEDEVWILPGLRAPAVMRPIKEVVEAGTEQDTDAKAGAGGATPRHHFVGACYVHGLMHGEAAAGNHVMLDTVELV